MQNEFVYHNNALYCEETDLLDLAGKAGTPVYVYSSRAILARFQAYQRALAGIPHRVCYAVKANANLAVLRLLAEAGAGFDIVSGGELFRVRRAGGEAGRVVFSGVGKTRSEIEYALEEGIRTFNCESEGELALIDSLAGRLGLRPSVAIRVNPDIDPATHPYTSTGLKEHKFGIDIAVVEDLYARARQFRHLQLDGVACHIGSQLLDAAPLVEAARKMVALVGRLRAQGVAIEHLDLGGGLGVPYQPGQTRPDLAGYLAQIRELIAGRNLTLSLEPGRFLIAEAGVLLTRVLYRKTSGAKEFVVVDAAMNDLLRPSLYHAYHEVWPLRRTATGMVRADIVGPVCESGDFLARDREVANVLPGDLVAVMTAGAYGMAMASNYNARPRPAEALVEGERWRIIRERETYSDLIRGEK
jgi:diaminopimelate decarboxylase